MQTLEHVLDTDVTPEMHAAWRKAHDGIALAMVQSAYPADMAAVMGRAALQGHHPQSPAA